LGAAFFLAGAACAAEGGRAWARSDPCAWQPHGPGAAQDAGAGAACQSGVRGMTRMPGLAAGWLPCANGTQAAPAAKKDTHCRGGGCGGCGRRCCCGGGGGGLLLGWCLLLRGRLLHGGGLRGGGEWHSMSVTRRSGRQSPPRPAIGRCGHHDCPPAAAVDAAGTEVDLADGCQGPPGGQPAQHAAASSAPGASVWFLGAPAAWLSPRSHLVVDCVPCPGPRTLSAPATAPACHGQVAHLLLGGRCLGGGGFGHLGNGQVKSRTRGGRSGAMRWV